MQTREQAGARTALWGIACNLGSVSYTHLDVYKRQISIPLHMPML